MQNSNDLNNIYLSKNKTQDLIINYFKKFLEIDEIDLEKNSYLQHMINVISMLFSNSILMNNIQNRENNLMTQQLPENVKNIAKYLGYNYKKQNPSNGSVEILIDLEELKNLSNFTITIPQIKSLSSTDGIDLNILMDFYKYTMVYLYSENIPFLLMNDITIEKKNGIIFVTEEDKKTGIIKNISYSYYRNESNEIDQNKIVINQPVEQVYYYQNKYVINNVSDFYEIETPSINKDEKIIDIEIYKYDPVLDLKEYWTEFDSVYDMASTSKGFVIVEKKGKKYIQFGNGTHGQLPKNKDIFYVSVKTTYGELGNVMPYSISYSGNFSTKINNNIYTIKMLQQNISSITGGQDEESIEMIKYNTINKIKNKTLLITENDFKNLQQYVFTNFYLSRGYIQRSDIISKEVAVYNVMKFADKVVPLYSTNLKIKTSDLIDSLQNKKAFIDIINLSDIVLEDNVVNPDGNGDIRLLPVFDSYINMSENKINFIMNKKIYNSNLNTTDVISENDIKLIGYTFQYNQNTHQYDLYLYTNKVKNTDYDELITSLSLVNYDIGFSTDLQDEVEIHEATHQTYVVHIDVNKIPISNFNIHVNFNGINYSSSQELKAILKHMYIDITTAFDGGVEYTYINGFPTIDENYFLNLSQEARDLLMTNLYNSVENFDLSTKTFIDFNLKFQNTNGNICALQYTKSTYTVDDVIISNYIPADNDKSFLILYNEMFDTSSDLYNNFNNIIVFHNSNKSYITPKNGDSVYVQSKNKKFIYSNNKWFDTSMQNPLHLDIKVDLKNENPNTITELKQLILSHYKTKFDFDMCFYRNELQKIILSHSNVENVEIINPKFDIKIQNITNDKVHKQFIYFTEDNINLIID